MAALAACGGKKTEPPAQVAPDAAVAVKRAAPDAAPAQPVVPTLYALSDGQLTVDIALVPPAGWRDQSDPPDRIVFNTDHGSWLKIGLTCDGACGDAAVARKNIEETALEAFEFTTSDSHVPQLAPQWDEKPAEAAPGVIRWAFHGEAASGEDWGEYQTSINRLYESGGEVRILECKVEVVKQDLALQDAMVTLCETLDAEKVPDDQLAWTITVTPEHVRLGDLGTVEIAFAAKNGTTQTLNPHRDALEVAIDGETPMQLAMAFGNGGVGREWRELPPGETASDRRSGVVEVKAAGDHVVTLSRAGHELARTTLHVDR